jgi:hypothetical protein
MKRLVCTLVVWLFALGLLVTSEGGVYGGDRTWTKGSTVRVMWTPIHGIDSVDVIMWDALHRRRVVLQQAENAVPGYMDVIVPDTILEHGWYRMIVVGGSPPRLLHQDEYYRSIIAPNQKVTPEEPDPVNDSMHVQLRPNPAAEQCDIVWPWDDVRHMLVRSLHGGVVMNQEISPANRTMRMHTSELPSGVYIVEIHRKRAIVRTKLMVMH